MVFREPSWTGDIWEDTWRKWGRAPCFYSKKGDRQPVQRPEAGRKFRLCQGSCSTQKGQTGRCTVNQGGSPGHKWAFCWLLSLYACTYMCLWMYVCSTYLYVGTHVETSRGTWVSSSVTFCLLVLRKGRSLNWKLPILARVSGHWAPEICLFLPAKAAVTGVQGHGQDFIQVLEILTQLLIL